MIWLSLIIAAPFLLCLFAMVVAWAVKRGREIGRPPVDDSWKNDPWLSEVTPENFARPLCDGCADLGREGGYPVLHSLGLGPQLDAMERICAASAAGKHAGESFVSKGAEHHFSKADWHMVRAGFGYGERESDSGELHLIHAAARLLMAAKCSENDQE